PGPGPGPGPGPASAGSPRAGCSAHRTPPPGTGPGAWPDHRWLTGYSQPNSATDRRRPITYLLLPQSVTGGMVAGRAARYPERVNVWDFLGSYWWLIFPLGGALSAFAGGWAKAVRRWDERRREHKLEMAKIKYGRQLPDGPDGGAVSGHRTGSREPRGR